jgi:hypothetical protein
MKRTWITVKRGILEPKHRFALGELIWLYMYILDITNWEAGVIGEWLDRGAAEEMEMPIATLRDQRMKLQEKGYITCERKQHGIRIIVHNWTNPKEYTGQKYNIKVLSDTPSHTLDTTLSNTPSDTAPVANSYPSIISKVKSQKTLKENITVFPEKFNTDKFKEIWIDWINFRKESKYTTAPTSIKLQIKKLSEYSEPIAIKMLENSIAAGWQGLFPPKDDKGKVISEDDQESKRPRGRG